MTPKQLYYETHYEKNDRDIGILIGFRYNHISELEALTNYNVQIDPKKNKRIEIRYYKNFDFDGRRFWRLASVWLDDEPVMIIQNAGREGDDHHRRFITHPERFNEMVAYIAGSCCTFDPPEKPKNDLYELDEDLGKELVEFYGNRLDGPFERYVY